MYADSTSITCSTGNIDMFCNDLKTECMTIAEWLPQSKRNPNTDKTEYMIIGHKQQINHIRGDINVVINGGNIQRAHEVKYLGFNVDENLNWNRQDKKLKSKLKIGLSSMRKLRNMLP